MPISVESLEVWTLSVRDESTETAMGIYSTPTKALAAARGLCNEICRNQWFVVCLDYLDAEVDDVCPKRRGIWFSATRDGKASAQYQPLYGKWFDKPETTLDQLIESECVQFDSISKRTEQTHADQR